jgi:hypothetical protein
MIDLLKLLGGLLPVACVECGGGRETAAATFALDTDAGGIKPKLACIRVQPENTE